MSAWLIPDWLMPIAASPDFMAVAIFGLAPLSLSLYVLLAIGFYRNPGRRWSVGAFLAVPWIAAVAAMFTDGGLSGIVFATLSALIVAIAVQCVLGSPQHGRLLRRLQPALLSLATLTCWYLFAIAAEASIAV